jgi:hypothetical protein
VRDIDEVLLEKIKQALRTVYNDADPKMDIIVAQTSKYLTPGLLLTPYTIRVNQTLGPLDIAVRREDENAIPQGLSMVYIEDGIAKVAWLNIEDHVGRGWKRQYDIGPAVDCAIDYDGRWTRITSFNDLYFTTTSRWALVTEGEPWIALVHADGSLTVRQGQHGTVLTLVADNVTKVSMLRSWKSVITGQNHDHGIVVAYIRDGEVKYRNYAEHYITLIPDWESEKTVPFDTGTYPAENVALFRTNDYRLGCLAEINGQLEWWISKRNWVGMAIPPETISASITNYTLALLPVYFYGVGGPAAATNPVHIKGEYQWGEHNSEKIAASITNYTLTLLYAGPLWPETIENIDDGLGEWGLYIKLTFNHDIYGAAGKQTAFSVTDSNSTPFSVQGTAQGDTIREVVLAVVDFNSAVGDITVAYTGGPGLLTGEGDQEVGAFSEAFTPVNLVPPAANPPEPEAIWNE